MRKTSVVTVLCLIGAGVAMAQQPEVRRTFAMSGTFELGGSASFSSYTQVYSGATGNATYSLAFSPSAGYFVIDDLELVVNPLTVDYAWSGSVNALSLMPMAGVAYNFRANPRAFPYLEGVAGFAYDRSDNGITASITRSGLAWAARGGVKFLLTGTAIVNVGVQYQQVTLNQSGEAERTGYNLIAVTAGISFWL
jgi:hypothetical protein